MTPPEHRLVVVNMSKWPTDLWDHRMYCCPAAEGGFERTYSHSPAKYIASYVQKGCNWVAVVAACVRLGRDRPHEVLWKFDDVADVDAVQRAEEVRAETKRNFKPCLVFLQSRLKSTKFEYDHAGGLQSSRVYFDLSGDAPNSVDDVAALLSATPWSQLPKWRQL